MLHFFDLKQLLRVSFILWCYFQSDFQPYFKTPVCGASFSYPNTKFAEPLLHATIPKIYTSIQTKTTAVIKSMTHFTQNGTIDILENNPPENQRILTERDF